MVTHLVDEKHLTVYGKKKKKKVLYLIVENKQKRFDKVSVLTTHSVQLFIEKTLKNYTILSYFMAHLL